MSDVFITATGSFLPNAPVDNHAMEKILGQVGDRPSRTRAITLRNNGIRTRHYALDPATGRGTHTNAQLTAEAVRDALTRAGWRMGDLDVLACGTASPDQLKPGHASMVHGELGGARLEAVSFAGVCCSGVAALKYAYLMVKSGLAQRATATGSELASTFMTARLFSPESPEQITSATEQQGLAFEKDFLRWMLSDGAGAALVAATPNPDALSLRIDWIDGVSLANELPVCMYSGAVKSPDGRLRGWREAGSPTEITRQHYFAIKQDARLLDQYVTRLIAADTIGEMLKRHDVNASQIDWFLPHYSSQYFRPVLAKAMRDAGAPIPDERWFSNLGAVGNIGAGAIYVMLDELWRKGRLKQGQRVLCFVPESARFSVYYMLLTVV